MDWFSDSLAWCSQPCGTTPTYLSICVFCWAWNWTTPLPSKYLLCFCSTTSVHVVPSTGAFLFHYCILSFCSSFEAELKGHNINLHSDPPPALPSCPARSSSFPFPSHFLGTFIRLTLGPVWVSRGHCLTVCDLPSGPVSVCHLSCSLTAVPCRLWALCKVLVKKIKVRDLICKASFWFTNYIEGKQFLLTFSFCISSTAQQRAWWWAHSGYLVMSNWQLYSVLDKAVWILSD